MANEKLEKLKHDLYVGEQKLRAAENEGKALQREMKKLNRAERTLFLGGKEKDTLKDLAEILGKETIDLYNTSDTRGTSQSYGLNYQKTGKDMP